MRGIDFAQHTVVPTPDQWAKIDADGYGDFVIIGVGNLNQWKRNAQIESALKAGKNPEGYIYLNAGRAESQMAEACVNLDREGYDLPFLWPDIEERGNLPKEQMVPILQRCVNIGVQAGYDRANRQGIYTGAWWWVPNTNNATAFADMALWTANYNTDLNGVYHPEWPIDFSWYVPYGGWVGLERATRRDTRQYRGTYDLHGVNVDLCWRNDQWKEEELDAEGLIDILEGMTPDQKNRFYKHGMKHADIDIFNPPADVPGFPHPTDEQWNHYVKDKLAAAGGAAGGGAHTHEADDWFTGHDHGDVDG
jgi:hypothetical protein